MIDWGRLAANGVWILGLSTILAAVSYHEWVAGHPGVRRRDVFASRAFLLPVAAGLCMTCVGWAATQVQSGGVKAMLFAGGGLFAWLAAAVSRRR